MHDFSTIANLIKLLLKYYKCELLRYKEAIPRKERKVWKEKLTLPSSGSNVIDWIIEMLRLLDGADSSNKVYYNRKLHQIYLLKIVPHCFMIHM